MNTPTRSALDNPLRSSLFTDLYELTMAWAYLSGAMNETAVFELFFRRMPQARSFVLAAGLADVLEYLEVCASLKRTCPICGGLVFSRRNSWGFWGNCVSPAT
jgi:nicotinic acid phosphoribosyltransferase